MSKKNLTLLIILALIVLIIVVGLITYLTNKAQVGELTITSDPSPIEVFVGNQRYETPVTISLKKGTYLLSGDKEKYLTYTGQYIMPDNKNHSIKINLKPDQVSPDQYAPVQ
jgi:hypothetical protein